MLRSHLGSFIFIWSYMNSYIKCIWKMQLSWKNISQAIREVASCFPGRLACFKFDLILFSKLLTEALFDPETNQLVLISAVLFLVWMMLTSGHHCVGQNNSHQPTRRSEKNSFRSIYANMWVWSLRLGLAGRPQSSNMLCPSKSVVIAYV